MALGPSVPASAFVVVYNPSQYINTITNGQNLERIEALKHLLDCLIQSDIDLITLGSIWLCVTGLLTNEEQQGSINTETRLLALKCISELIKIDQLQRRFFNLWLSFDFLIRYKIENENDAVLWLECFYSLTDNGRRMDHIDDRLRVRILTKLINAVLTGPMSRNNHANQILRELFTNICHLRYDEISVVVEHIFEYLNHDEDDALNLNRNLYQQSIRKCLDILGWLIHYHTLNTTLLHYFIQNIVDLHDKYTFSAVLNTELLQLITTHLPKTPSYGVSVISILCGIIVERLETPMNNDIDPLSTLLFVLTQTLIDIRQYRSIDQHHVQLSNADITHQKCFQNTIQQLPLCWLTVLHQVYVKRQNVNIILINFQQFLTTLNVKTPMCALNLFNMNVWKMMHEIMKICHQYLIIDKKSPTTVPMYEECLMILANLANQLCCLPHNMVTDLFDIKRLTSIQKTPLREQMFKQSYAKLLCLIRPNNSEWSTALKEVVEYIILNANEAVTTRIDVLTTVFEKYLWFKMTDQVTTIGLIILDALENLILIDLNALTEDEFLSKHALMKQNAVKSIFEHFLSDHSIDSTIAHHCYKIIQMVYEQDCAHITSVQSIHRPLIEIILEQMYLLFENNLSYSRLTSVNHCSFILDFFVQQCASNYAKIVSFAQTKIRLLIWQLLLNMRLRSSDSAIGMISFKTNLTVYGVYRLDTEHKAIENENLLAVAGYLAYMIDWLRMESPDVINTILEYVCAFLKEQSMVKLSGINIEQLISLLIDKFHDDLLSKTQLSSSLKCLLVCTSYKTQISHLDSIINCFLEAMNSSKSSFIVMAIQAFTLSLANLSDEIQEYLPRIIFQLTKTSNYDMHITQTILEFLMHLLFEKFHDISLTRYLFQILIDIINQHLSQTAHNLILAHTLLCFYFKQLLNPERHLFAYFILRSLPTTSLARSCEPSSLERPSRLHRSGSLSSLNDDSHANDPVRRKMTVLDTASILSSSSNNVEDNNPLKKLNDELLRITTNYINEHLWECYLPSSVLVLLPREVRRHHLNNSWLADEKILYQIQSFDFNQLNTAKDVLPKVAHEGDDATKNRFRRYTDGNKQHSRRNKELHLLTKCQDDLHVRSLELDTNRSMFNERNLWIAVTVRSFTSTKTFLAINLSASAGLLHQKNEKLHWFEAIKLTDTSTDKSISVKDICNYCAEEHTSYLINEIALKDELQSVVNNVDRKDEENFLNRHNDYYYPRTVHRVPSDAHKYIEPIDNIKPVRVAKIGVIYIHSEQKITESNILSNIQTSQRYKQFMSSIATLKSIRSLEQDNFYRPLLDVNNSDNCGQYAYVWQNPVYQVLFHTSTLMPNTRADHEFKKKLIGNDCVIIVYNESEHPFDMKTLKTGVCRYMIEVCPQINSNYTRIRLIRRNHSSTSHDSSVVDFMSSNGIDYLISDDHVASYVRILALCLCQQGELENRPKTSSSSALTVFPWLNRFQTFRSLHTCCCLSYHH
ncbi:unnamed protein product [Adineta ricciae]|uniref:Rap-GAP domain-containing protein n=2 Tax=Adineta ricciae TaxID=249248 RepID=A0A813PRN5_ADIRI|nr:unnamed protein product [Adineta ricciae]CAF0757986.1 unnamed protein product [Adineta ricciae]